MSNLASVNLYHVGLVTGVVWAVVCTAGVALGHSWWERILVAAMGIAGLVAVWWLFI